MSGKDLMLSRLFHISDPSLEPPVEYNHDRSYGLVYDFLTTADRKQIAQIYDYAVSQGKDLEQVDLLAFNWANYRSRPDCSPAIYFNDRKGIVEGGYDPTTGKLAYAEFDPESEAIAQRLLTSKALNDNTIINSDFLRVDMEPGRFGKRSLEHMQFVQELVFAFSPSGDAVNPNATLPLRPHELAEMKYAELRAKGWDSSKMTALEFESKTLAVARGENPNGGLFGKYQNRLDSHLSGFFTAGDKSILGEAYEMASDKGVDLKRIDKLAAELGALRIQQQLTGELIRATTNRDADADKRGEMDMAHMAILGEMHRMSGL